MSGVKGRSGGRRVGAGHPRRTPAASWLAGATKKRRAPAVVPADIDVSAPADMPPEIAAVWHELAPHATAERTLTPRTAAAFAMLCKCVWFERRLAAGPLSACGPDHRGMLARVETGFARFRLTADGKPAPAVEQPVDEWSAFDMPLQVVQGGKP